MDWHPSEGTLSPSHPNPPPPPHRDLSLFHQWVIEHSCSFRVLSQALTPPQTLSKEEQIQVVVIFSPTLLQLFWSLAAFI